MKNKKKILVGCMAFFSMWAAGVTTVAATEPETQTNTNPEPVVSYNAGTMNLGTYNLHNSAAGNIALASSTVNALSGMNYDILGFNEMDAAWLNRFEENKTPLINKGYWVAHCGDGVQSGSLGVGMMYNASKYRLEQSYGVVLDQGLSFDVWNNKRFAQVGIFTDLASGLAFVDIEIHMDWVDYFANFRQATQVLSIAKLYENLGYPVFIAGDYNMDNNFYKAAEILSSGEFELINTGNTYLENNDLNPLILDCGLKQCFASKLNQVKTAAASKTFTYTSPIGNLVMTSDFSDQNIMQAVNNKLPDAELIKMLNQTTSYRLDYISYNSSNTLGGYVKNLSSESKKLTSDHMFVGGKFQITDTAQNRYTKDQNLKQIPTTIQAAGFQILPVSLIRYTQLSKTSETLYVGATDTITLKGAGIKTVSSSNNKVANMTVKGQVKGLSSGTAQIKISDVYGKSYTCKVTVKAVSINYKALTLKKGAGAVLKLNGATVKKISSASSKIATVDKAGKVKAVKKGTTTITLTGSNGSSYKCKVTVK